VRITCIETLQCRTYPNLVWVQVHTDSGLIGLGRPSSARGRGGLRARDRGAYLLDGTRLPSTNIIASSGDG